MGWWGALAVGVPVALALVLLSHLLIQWHHTPISQRVMLGLGMIFSVCGAILLTGVAFQNGMFAWREQIREVSRLESALHEDQRFRSVFVTCEGVAAGQWLRVRGIVQSQRDLDDLRQTVAEIKLKWPVHVQVELVEN
jgi:hypothetical protein